MKPLKKLIILSAATIALMLGACNNSAKEDKASSNDSIATTIVNSFDTTKLAQGATFYQCPMDPEELSDKPGTCSKCGMDLEKVVKN